MLTFIITGLLQARTAFHIGTGESSDSSDALIKRDVDGKPYIPGFAIAGALREMATRLAPRMGHTACKALRTASPPPPSPCDCVVCRMFGDLYPVHESEIKTSASKIWTYHAPVTNQAFTSIRDGVGISRQTGTAARETSAKFDLEIAPKGTCFSLRLELRTDDINAETEKSLLAAVLHEWERGRFWLGRGAARGLGGFDLEASPKWKLVSLDEPDTLMAFLSCDDSEMIGTEIHSDQLQYNSIPYDNSDKDIAPHVAGCWAKLSFDLRFHGPMLVSDALSAGVSGFDQAPLLAHVCDWKTPILPGSSLRGVLRSQAEKIARTVVHNMAMEHPINEASKYFKTHCPACDPMQNNPKKPMYKCSDKINDDIADDYDTIVNKLCPACQLFGCTVLGSRLYVEDGIFSGEKPIYKMLDFLAIDRFTGGGSDGKKFDALVLWNPRFRCHLFINKPKAYELGWMAFTLRDLDDLLMTTGYGKYKGFGEAHIRKAVFEMGLIEPSDLPIGPQKSEMTWAEQWDKNTVQDGLYRIFTIKQGEWANESSFAHTLIMNWTTAFYEYLAGKPLKNRFKRPSEMIDEQDAFWDAASKYYPVEELSLEKE